MRPAASFFALLVLAPALARADGTGDGLYGRFDDSVTLAVGAGGGVSLGATDDARGAGVLELRCRILDSAGPVVSGSLVSPHDGRLFAGVELRPLFPALFLLDLSTGHEWLDLFLGSIGGEIGAAFDFDGAARVGLGWGLAVELPLLSPSRFQQGVWLRLAARHTRMERTVGGASNRGSDEWTLYATLAVKLGLGTRQASWEPRRYVVE